MSSKLPLTLTHEAFHLSSSFILLILLAYFLLLAAASDDSLSSSRFRRGHLKISGYELGFNVHDIQFIHKACDVQLNLSCAEDSGLCFFRSRVTRIYLLRLCYIADFEPKVTPIPSNHLSFRSLISPLHYYDFCAKI